MAKKKTIGILNAIVTADAAQLRKEFASVDNTVRRSTTGWQKGLKDGLKIGAGITGAQMGFGAIAAEIQHVIQNVESIPGINPQAVATIVEARTEFAKFRNTIDSGIASVVAFGADLLKSVGAGAAMLMGASGADVSRALTKLETPDDIARGKDTGYDDKLAAARAHLNEVKRAGLIMGTTEVAQIKELYAQAQRYETFAQSSSINSVQRLEAETKAQDFLNQAKQKQYDLGQKVNQVQEQISSVMHENGLIGKKDAETLNALNAKRLALWKDIGAINHDIMHGEGNKAENTQALLDKDKELLQVEKDRGQLLKAQEAAYKALGSSVASSIEDAVLSGATLREMLQSIEQDILRIAFRTAVTQPLGELLGGGLKGLFGGFFAAGGNPPVGKASIVGENGPELFVPGTSGTIVPNYAMQGGRSGGGNTYIIDAKGQDGSAIDRAVQVMMQLAGPGVVERRALAATTEYSRRGR